MKYHQEGSFYAAAAAAGLLLCASCTDDIATTEDSDGASAGSTSSSSSSSSTTSDPEPDEPMMSVPECADDTYVGRRTDGGACGSYPGALGSWVGASLGGEGVLASFCEYRWTPVGQAEPDLTALPKLGDGVASLVELCARVTAQAGYLSADQSLRKMISAEFMANIGKPLAPMPPGPGIAPVELRLIDTVPKDILEKGLMPRSEHGLTLHDLSLGMLCDGGDCRARVYNNLGLPRISEAEEDRILGGYFGSLVDLARGINEGVQQWDSGGMDARLVLVLALGWEGIDKYGVSQFEGKSLQEMLVDPEAPADLLYVLASLSRASCRGALTVAAAGNSTAEPCVQKGPTGPGFFAAIPGPDAGLCEALGFAHSDADLKGAPSLVLAATHVTPEGGAPANARIGALAPLVAQGSAFGSVEGAGDLLTGSSVASAVVGGAAAWVWSYYPTLTPAQVQQVLYDGGTPLPGQPIAEFSDAVEAHQVSICGALLAACEGMGGTCSDFPACPKGSAVDPEIAVYLQAKLETPCVGEPGCMPPNLVSLGPGFPASGQSPSACGGEVTVWPDTAQPPLPLQPPFPWTNPQPGASVCPSCIVGIVSNGKGLNVGLDLKKDISFDGPIFVEVQTSTGTHRIGISFDLLDLGRMNIVDVVPPFDWGQIQRVSLGYVIVGLDGNRQYRSEPLMSFRYPCEGPPKTCYDQSLSDAQEGVGICEPGVAKCTADGWVCQGGGVPEAEDDCSTPDIDEDCDGNALNLDCECIDGEALSCQYPPDIAWKAGNGICTPTEQMCVAGVWDECLLNLPAAQEDCATPDIDENCDGVVPCGEGVLTLVAGDLHTCALTDDGSVRCWGVNTQGILGTGKGDIAEKFPPGPINLGPGTRAIDLEASVRHTCAILDTGDVMCWGRGIGGSLGYANQNDVGLGDEPANAGTVDVDGKVSKIATGWTHTCVLREDDKVLCWGNGLSGRLGYGNTNTIGDNEDPASAGSLLLPGGIIDLVAGGSHTCALFEGGTVKCWGAGSSGQLGYGNTDDIGDNESLAGLVDVPVGAKVVELAANLVHTCARLESGDIKCWGDNAGGRLGYDPGDAKIGDDEVPADMPALDLGGPALTVTAGQDFTCVRLVGDLAKCWGLNDVGQLGQGNTEPVVSDLANLPPIDVGGLVGIIDITAGWRHVCVRTSGNAGKCWGDGGSYQLGNGLIEIVGDDLGEPAKSLAIKFPW